MISAPLPPDEAERLEALRAYEVLDTPTEEIFDNLARLAAFICGVPVAMISLVDEHRQWFKAHIGVDTTETSRDIAFCAHAIHGRDLFIVPDATADERFADNPLVQGEPHITFYAGAPLVTPGGQAVGVLCVIDRQPRQLSPEQQSALRVIAQQVIAQLELRRNIRMLVRTQAERDQARVEAVVADRTAELRTARAESERRLVEAERSRHALLSLLEDQQRATASLRESEERFKQLADSVNEVFWLTDGTLTEVLYMSPNFERVWGRAATDLTRDTHTWLETVHPDDRDRIARAWRTKPAAGTYDEEYRILRPDGAVRWIRERAFPVRDASGTTHRIAGVAEDVTERRHLELQLRQSQKLDSIGQLAAGVAHDFNNILTVIQGHASLLYLAHSNDPDVKEHAQQIGLAAERAASLTGRLLLFSRQQALQPRMVNLNEAVTGLAKMLQRLLGEDIRMQLNLHRSALWTHADPAMLDQVLMNLSVNARDAMPTGGQLTITTGDRVVTPDEARGIPDAAPGPYVSLTVSDTGCGIAPDNLAHIFEPFFTTKAQGRGTGLGLATVFGIVRQHGGWIDVESTVGRGSTFHILLPARAMDDAPEPGAATPARPRGGSETIFIVEDEPAVRRLTRIVLERQGYKVIEASNGAEALRIREQYEGPVHLLLTDMVMPEGITGRELARRLQARNPELKVIFTSGYSPDLTDPELHLKEGENFLQKPCPMPQLLDTVRRRLDG